MPGVDSNTAAQTVTLMSLAYRDTMSRLKG